VPKTAMKILACRLDHQSTASRLVVRVYGDEQESIVARIQEHSAIVRLVSCSHSERSWLSALETLNQYAYRHGFTKAILQEACALFRSQTEALKLRGETRRALMGAVFFVACRRMGVSRTHEEMSEIVNVSTRSLSKAIQTFGLHAKRNPLLKTQLSLAERMMNGLSIQEHQRTEILGTIQISSSPPTRNWNIRRSHGVGDDCSCLVPRQNKAGNPGVPQRFLETFWGVGRIDSKVMNGV